MLYHARRYDSAIEQLQKTLELDPNFGAAHEYLGLAYLQKSLYKEGLEELQKGLLDSPDSPGPLWKLGYAYAVTGRSREALGMLDKLHELSKNQYVPPVAQALSTALWATRIRLSIGSRRVMRTATSGSGALI